MTSAAIEIDIHDVTVSNNAPPGNNHLRGLHATSLFGDVVILSHSA